MEPENNRKIRNFRERNEYLKGEQHTCMGGVVHFLGIYKLLLAVIR